MNQRDRFDLINVIADAGLKVLHEQGCRIDKLSMFMDLDYVDADCPLRLAEMASAAVEYPLGYDFRHDIVGIWNHFDRQTKTLNNGFLPRYAIQ